MYLYPTDVKCSQQSIYFEDKFVFSMYFMYYTYYVNVFHLLHSSDLAICVYACSEKPSCYKRIIEFIKL